ncbi:hypothetical protein ACP4OV_030332 [Aristida adscensionis]
MNRSKGKLSGVLHKGFKADKCKTSLRMAVARIKLLRNRKEVQVRKMRQELAQLLEANQDQTARIRVEHVIREEKFMQAYDLIEVYCELIVARLSIIDSQKACPIDLKEAIATVIFASMRCADVTELADVRKHFTSKYGKEFAAAALEVRPDCGVNRLVIEKLSAGAPDIQSKIKTLSSIAEEHNIKWEPKAFEEKLQKPSEDLLHGSATYSGASFSAMGSSTSSMSSSQPMYSGVSAATVDAATSGPYASAEVSANRTPYGTTSSSAFSQEDSGGSNASVPPSSQHGPSAYSSAQIPGPKNILHGKPEGPSVSRPHSQYDAMDSVRDEEINQPRERKPSVSGSNWNVEFKDATSAAQAAAESAEMASIAARAAAQLASRGHYSGEQSTEAYESAAYNRKDTPRKQSSEHLVKDEQRNFHYQGAGINDPRVMSSNTRKHSGGVETDRVDNQNISAAHDRTQQFHSYSPESHPYDYEMRTETPRAHSPQPPHFDDLYERESNVGRSEVYQVDNSGKKLQDAAHGGPNIKDVEIRQGSFDQQSTSDYYGNLSSSPGKYTHGSSTIWDNQNDKTKDSSSVVFDQYDSDVGEENLLDAFSKHTEQLPGVQDHMGFSTADWSQQHIRDSPIDHRTSTLFSRTEAQPTDNLGADRRDIPSPHSYNNLPPTFDSDGCSSDEEIPTTMHAERAESLKSRSRRSTSSGLNKEANASSGKLVPDISGNIEDYESGSRRKYGASPGHNVSYKEQHSGGSPRSDYPGAQGQRSPLIRVQSRDSDLSDEETVPDNLKGASSAGANEKQTLPFAMQSSATSDDNDKGDLGLNFGRLTPGLRNKPRQPPPYTKNRESMLPRQSLHKASVITEDSDDTEENSTPSEKDRNIPKSSYSTIDSFGGNSTSEPYDRNQSVGTNREARSRNSFDTGVTEKLREQHGNTSHPMTVKSSEHVTSSQELYHENQDTGARREMRSRVSRNYFDSDDSEEELEQQHLQSKQSGEPIQSRRTREVTLDTKRDSHVRIGASDGKETESMPKETQPFTNSSTERRRDAPGYSRVSVRRAPPKTEQAESPMARGKSQEVELDKGTVIESERNTETSAGTPKESTPKNAPSHVHPKLPTDYDSFAAHFMSLRTNRR